MNYSTNSFFVLDNITSTNNYAMEKAHAGLAKHGDAFYAKNQTAGKGQRGKAWLAGNNENITISMVAEPIQFSLSEQFSLSMTVALACYNFFEKYAGNDVTIKWPNDIYWRDRKAGGILIENIVTQKKGKPYWKFAIIGVGLNINQTIFDKSLTNPVSLKQITGKTYNLIELAKELHTTVMELIKNTNGNILENYNQKLYRKGSTVKLKKGSIEFETTIKEVCSNGKLFTTDIMDNYFDFGEVEWIV